MRLHSPTTRIFSGVVSHACAGGVGPLLPAACPRRADSSLTFSSPFAHQTGPHLYQTCPSGNYYEYKAIAIGARSQASLPSALPEGQSLVPRTIAFLPPRRYPLNPRLFLSGVEDVS